MPRDLLYKPRKLKSYIKSINPDYILHLSAYGNHYMQTSESKTFKANVLATYNLLNITKEMSYKGFANFATTKHNLESNTFYGATKSAGEYLVRAFVRKYNLPIINIRPYSVYGAGERSFRFIPAISKNISKGLPIKVTDVSHDWVYVEDFIDGLLDAIRQADKYKGKSIGIGTGKRRWNMEIAEELQNIAGKRVKIKKGKKRSYEVPYFNYAKTSLKEGLKKVYEKQRLKEKDN